MESPFSSINQIQFITLGALDNVERPTFQKTNLRKIYYQTSHKDDFYSQYRISHQGKTLYNDTFPRNRLRHSPNKTTSSKIYTQQHFTILKSLKPHYRTLHN